MNDAALAGRHGAELIRRAGLAHFIGGDGGSGAQFLDAQRAVILAVEADLFMLAGGQAQHFKGEQFEGAKQFSAAIEQEGGVGAGEIHEDIGLLPVAIVGHGRIDYDAVFQAESAVSDDGLEEFVDFVGSSDFVHKSASRKPAFSGQPSAISWADILIISEPSELRPESLMASGAKLARGSMMLPLRYLSFLRWRLAIISRISWPRWVRFMTACWAIPITFTTA